LVLKSILIPESAALFNIVSIDVDEKVGIMPFCHDRYLGSNPDISQKSKKVIKAKKGKDSCPPYNLRKKRLELLQKILLALVAYYMKKYMYVQ